MKHYTKLALLAAAALAVAAPAANATLVDLTTAGAFGSIGAGYFEQINPQSTGTGVIDAFVRIQNSGTEQGFNTDFRPLTGDLADVNTSAQFTKSITVNSFGVVDQNGTPSIRFLLDVNQTGANPLISLDELQILTADRGDIGSLADLYSEGTMIYDMDAIEDSEIHLDFSLNSGSGSGDMFAYLPSALFAGQGSKYLYLYSQFGGTYPTNDGFEEWARVDGTVENPIPEPTTVMLLGGGLLAGAVARRRRKKTN